MTRCALQHVQQLLDVSASAGVPRNIAMAIGSSHVADSWCDDVSQWWAAILGVSAHWLIDEDDNQAASKFYSIIEQCPKQLLLNK